MDALRPFLGPTGEPTVLAATLHIVREERARSTVEVVEVRINDERIGILSPQQSRNYGDMVRHIAEYGRTPTVRALLKGNSVKAELTLYAAKPQDIADAELSTL